MKASRHTCSGSSRLSCSNEILKPDELDRFPVSGPEKRLSRVEGKLLFMLAKSLSRGQSAVYAGGSQEVLECMVKGFSLGQGRRIYYKIPLEDTGSVDAGNLQTAVDCKGSLDQENFNDAVIPFDSSVIASRKCKEKIALLWVEISDSCEHLNQTLMAWQSRLASDAKIIFHGAGLPALAGILKDHLGELGDLTFLESVGTAAILGIDRCTHHWIIDSQDIGICKLCGRRRDFKRIRNMIQGKGK